MKPPPSDSGERLTAFALSNSVPMNLLFVVLVVVGAIVIAQMPVDVYPDVSLDEATIDTIWLGASAEDIERLVTDRIEEKIQDIRGIDRIISDSKSDASLIRAKFRESLSDLEYDAAFRELRAAVDQVTDLPEDAEKPIVTKISVNEVFVLIWIIIEDVGGVGEEVLHDVAFRIKPAAREIPGVAKVDDRLIRDREVHIKADRDALRKYGLTLQDLEDILRQTNRDLPSGPIEQAGSEISIRVKGSVLNPQELGSIVVLKNPQGGHVYLRDVAGIEIGFERKTFFARYDQNKCLALGITKTHAGDSRVVSRRVREAVEQYKKTLPPGVGLRVFADTSRIISSRLHVLTNNLAGGIVLVFLVLWVAVGLRNSILAIIGIPFSFGCALIAMHMLGVSINAISLIGLVLCGGMIVDDAIVVLENIYRHIQEGNVTRGDRSGLFQAITKGTGEVLWPVVSSSATTVAAFMPLLIMTGVMGEFFAIIPKTVTVVLLASLFECLLILPVHYLDFGYRKRASASSTASARVGQGITEAGKRLYGRFLAMTLQHRYLVPLPLVALALCALAVLPLIDVELFPSDFQLCLVDIQTADEASLDRTGEIIEPIEELVLSLEDQVEDVMVSFGLLITEDNAVKMRNNVAQMHVELKSDNKIGADSTVVANIVRDKIDAYVTANPDCGIRSFRVWAPRSGPPVGKPVAIRIESPDFKVAKRLAEQYKSELLAIDGISGLKDNLEFGRQQINLTINEDLASVHNLTFLDLASAIRTANDGQVVSTFKDTRSGEDLDVRLMLDERYRSNVEALLDLDIRCPAGYVIQAGQIADVGVVQGYAGIPHYNGKRVITITAELDTNKTTSQEVNELLKRRFDAQLATMPIVRVTYGGQFAETESSFSSLRDAFVIAMVVIYFLLATQFRSYAQPLVIVSTVPFAWIGVVGGLLLGGYPFTTMTFIAIVGMSGVVVNDSILLVDCANQKKRDGMESLDAIYAACLQRLRPVLMTTITTVLGLAPLALGLGGRSKIWSPFASSFVWGLSFATLVTLIVVPAAYCIVHDAAGFFRRLAGLESPPTVEEPPTTPLPVGP